MPAPDETDPGERPARADATPADALGAARPYLSAAATLGTPALRAGDPRGAYEIYAAAARVVAASAADAPRSPEVLSALDHSDLEPDPRVRAGILHTLFRELLGNYPDPAGLDDPPDYDPADALDPRELVHGYLTQALSLGEPARALGSDRGCYEVFAASARMILTSVVGPEAALARLQGALDEAAAVRSEPRKATVMRRAFDEILAANCTRRGPAVTRREMRLMISMAMQLGAPAYNLGDHRGCYETYACCARLLSRTAPEAAAAGLRDALTAAAVELDVSEQAWILRRAFDALIEGE